MIDIDDYSHTIEKQEWESNLDFRQRLKEYAIQGELEKAGEFARNEYYEEAILKLVDIIETIQDKS